MPKNTDVCDICGIEKHIYSANDCITQFCNYLFTDVAMRAERNGYVHVFSYNAFGYHSQFLLQEICRRDIQDSSVVMQARKILKMTVENINPIDSLLFFLQPLSALPEAFGLNAYIGKGYLPHYFNCKENYDYVRPMPSLEYYGVEYMKPDQAQKVRDWYIEQINNQYVFDFKNELIMYCQKDVDL